MSGDTEPYKTQELILKRQWICSLDLKTYWKNTSETITFCFIYIHVPVNKKVY